MIVISINWQPKSRVRTSLCALYWMCPSLWFVVLTQNIFACVANESFMVSVASRRRNNRPPHNMHNRPTEMLQNVLNELMPSAVVLATEDVACNVCARALPRTLARVYICVACCWAAATQIRFIRISFCQSNHHTADNGEYQSTNWTISNHEMCMCTMRLCMLY